MDPSPEQPNHDELRPVIEVTGSGPHYVWNEDQTGLVAKDGPIDGTRPFFVAPITAPDATPQEWPAGWIEMGATDERGAIWRRLLVGHDTPDLTTR